MKTFKGSIWYTKYRQGKSFWLQSSSLTGTQRQRKSTFNIVNYSVILKMYEWRSGNSSSGINLKKKKERNNTIQNRTEFSRCLVYLTHNCDSLLVYVAILSEAPGSRWQPPPAATTAAGWKGWRWEQEPAWSRGVRKLQSSSNECLSPGSLWAMGLCCAPAACSTVLAGPCTVEKALEESHSRSLKCRAQTDQSWALSGWKKDSFFFRKFKHFFPSPQTSKLANCSFFYRSSSWYLHL